MLSITAVIALEPLRVLVDALAADTFTGGPISSFRAVANDIFDGDVGYACGHGSEGCFLGDEECGRGRRFLMFVDGVSGVRREVVIRSFVLLAVLGVVVVRYLLRSADAACSVTGIVGMEALSSDDTVACNKLSSLHSISPLSCASVIHPL